MKVLVTGCAGFIGFHTVRRLLNRGDSVVGFDVVNDYYDPTLKESRLRVLADVARESGGQYTFVRSDLAESAPVNDCIRDGAFDRVIHLAAQAGVRHSIANPQAYVRSNITAFTNILEACRHAKIPHLTYASSSSVYGGNTAMPFSEHVAADHPLQFYAATKRANELMAHAYSHLFRLPTTGLRFFTVYGPWGRPDMALFLFVKNTLEGKPIQLFNNGDHTRDFTYVDDIVEGIVRVSDAIATPNPGWDGSQPDPASSNAPFRLLNIGSNKRVRLSDYVDAVEVALGKKAVREYLPMQPGDVADTFADVTELVSAVGYKPSTSVEVGVSNFVGWYRSYYGV
jgi:UDP-glucuronate 4-epimerase